MRDIPTDDLKLQFTVLKEMIWSIEDKVNVILDDITEHDAELRKLKHALGPIMRKLKIDINNGRLSPKNKFKKRK